MSKGNFCLLLFFMFYALLAGKSVQTLDISPRKTLVFGPGLNAHLVYPARYFFIQTVSQDGANFSTSPGDIFHVEIAGIQNRCRIWTQTLDRFDGSFIIRYKMYHTCSDLKIRITYKGTDVAKSPYTFKGPLHHEECYCPSKHVNLWLDDMECPETYPQIENDLETFSQINMADAVNSAKQRFRQAGSYSLCHYAIIKQEVYRECIGQHVGFTIFVDATLLSLLRKINLPDVEFMVNLGDWPLVQKSNSQNPLPIFSWCKSNETLDIVMPTYDLTESTLESMGRVMLDMMTVQSKTGPDWENKTEKAFWRGRDSRQERLQLVALARRYPHMIDAALTNFFFFRDLESEYGPKVKHVSFFDFFQFKYQINIDGTVAAYRFPYLLAGNGVVLKQDSAYYEHFYHQLVPMVHYIPFKHDLSDLIEKIQWAIEHDVEAKRIGLNGRKFAQENLMAKDIYCYHAILLKKFKEKLRNQPKKTQNMEHVPQPNDHENCRCQIQNMDKDEL